MCIVLATSWLHGQAEKQWSSAAVCHHHRLSTRGPLAILHASATVGSRARPEAPRNAGGWHSDTSGPFGGGIGLRRDRRRLSAVVGDDQQQRRPLMSEGQLAAGTAASELGWRRTLLLVISLPPACGVFLYATVRAFGGTHETAYFWAIASVAVLAVVEVGGLIFDYLHRTTRRRVILVTLIGGAVLLFSHRASLQRAGAWEWIEAAFGSLFLAYLAVVVALVVAALVIDGDLDGLTNKLDG